MHPGSRRDGMQASKVLVPVRGDESDNEALSLACEMTRGTKGKVYVLYVMEIQRYLPLDADPGGELAKGEEVLQRMEKLGEQFHGDIEAEILRARDAGPAVVQEAEEREVEAIVVAVPYKTRYGVFSLGSTVPYILKNATCPVLLWRQQISTNGATSATGRNLRRGRQRIS